MTSDHKTRSKVFTAAAIQLLLLLVCFSSQTFAESIRFAPLPMVSKEALNQQFLPLTRHLSEVTGEPVKQLYYQNYQTLIEDLHNDEIDLAYLGPLPYVLLKRIDPGFIPLVRFVDAKGESTYTCSLASFEQDFSLDNLTVNTTIAMPQPYSTCAYLMTESLLKRQQLSLEALRYYYAGNHTEAALDVIRGKATVAGLKTSVARQYRHLGLQVVELDVALPGHLLVANPRTLSAQRIEQIRSHLLLLAPRHNPVHRELTSSWGKDIRYGAIPVAEGDYRYIDEQLGKVRIPGVEQ